MQWLTECLLFYEAENSRQKEQHRKMSDVLQLNDCLTSHSTMVPKIKDLSSHSSMFLQLYVSLPTALCSQRYMFPQFYVSTAVCLTSHSIMFPKIYVPSALSSHNCMFNFPQHYVPRDLCSHSSMFLQLYV